MSPADAPTTDTPVASSEATPSLAAAMHDLANGPPGDFPFEPQRLGLANCLSAQSQIKGECHIRGGLLLQGQLSGSGEIAGPLVIWHGAHLSGHFRVMGDVYLFGALGQAEDNPESTTSIECHGTVHMGNHAISNGALFAARLAMSDGATLTGPFRTLPGGTSLPVLHPVE